MLQPRIPLRRLCQNYQPFSTTLRRNYAHVVDTVQQSTTTTDGPPASSQAQSQLGQSKLGPVRGEQALRRYTPRTPGVRHLIRPINDHIWKGRPLFNLTYPKKGQSRGGRNHTGHVVMRHRGGGHKRRIRTVDFRRDEGGEHLVERIEHDPNRTAHIALVRNIGSGERSYILAAEGMRAGDVVHSYRKGLPQDLLESLGGALDQGIIASKTAHRGNCLKLGMIPIGTPIFNLSLDKKSEAKVCRSAGTHGIIVGKGEDTVQKEMIKVIGDTGALNASQLTAEQLRKFEKAANFVTVRLSSGEVRLFDKNAVATIGMASNANHKYSQLGKAGRKRWLGIRPTVRGLAMNACDHPHGGGRGKSKGNVDPVSPWGRPAKSGYKTRPKNKVNKMVVQERPRNQGKRRRGYA